MGTSTSKPAALLYCTFDFFLLNLLLAYVQYTIHLSRFGNAFTLKNNHTTGLLTVFGKSIRYFLWFSHLFLQNSRHKSKISREVIQIIECTYWFTKSLQRINYIANFASFIYYNLHCVGCVSNFGYLIRLPVCWQSLSHYCIYTVKSKT